MAAHERVIQSAERIYDGDAGLFSSHALSSAIAREVRVHHAVDSRVADVFVRDRADIETLRGGLHYRRHTGARLLWWLLTSRRCECGRRMARASRRCEHCMHVETCHPIPVHQWP